MKIFRWILLGQLLAASFVVLAQSSTTATSQATGAQKQQAQKRPPINDGERVFTQNCSRCHNPPDGFSPRIAGSVVRHMRVRANLSEKEAQAVLRFFNP